MGKLTHEDITKRLQELQVEYQELRKQDEALRKKIEPLTAIDKAERKLAQLYAQVEENWNDTSDT